MTRIAVIGEMHSPNLGDAAIFEGIAHSLASASIETVPIGLLTQAPPRGERESPPYDDGPASTGSVVRSKLAKSPRMRRVKNHADAARRFRFSRERMFSVVSSADAVLIGGGQLLTDVDFGMPPQVDLAAKVARSAGKPVAYVGVGASQDFGWCAKRIYRRALQGARVVVARDAQSGAWLKELSGRDVEVHADLAMAKPRRAAQRQTGLVGVNIMAEQHLSRYVADPYQIVAGYVSLCREMALAGKTVRILTNGDAADQRCAGEVYQRLQNEGFVCQLAPAPKTLSSLEQEISRLDAMVATRMHAGILAWSMGVATVPLTWDPKIPAVWSVFSGVRPLDADVLLEPRPWALIESQLRPADAQSIAEASADANAAIRLSLEQLL